MRQPLALLAVTTLAACTSPHGTLPRKQTCPEAEPDPLPIAKDLLITSRTPLINRDAWLIAGFFDFGDSVAFTAMGFDNHVHEHDFARKNKPAEMARLQKEVTAYLSKGVWRQMLLGERRLGNEGETIWVMGNFSAGANADAELGVRDDDGGGVGGSPTSRYLRMNECDRSVKLEVVDVAVDPKTKWIWATNRPTSEGSCPSRNMTITFQAWTGVLYPQLITDGVGAYSPSE